MWTSVRSERYNDSRCCTTSATHFYTHSHVFFSFFCPFFSIFIDWQLAWYYIYTKKTHSNSQWVHVHYIIRPGVASWLNPPPRIASLHSGGEVRPASRKTKTKQNSPPLQQPDLLAENGSTLCICFPPESCTLTVTKQYLPLHNRPTKTLLFGP